MRELERRVVLSVLDRKWREHLYEMDYLREGIYLRAYSQRDPLVEYQREGFDMFAAMMDGIKEESVGFLFNLQVEVEEDDEEVEDEAEPVPVAAPQVVRRHAPDRLRAGAGARPADPGQGPREARRARRTCPTAPLPRTARPRCAPRRPGDDDPFAGVGRNSLCPCGSGKKFKRCHGAPGGASGYTTRAGG